MPMRAIGMLLGIPEEDQEAVRDRVDANLRTEPGEPMEIGEDRSSAASMFAEYIDWRAEHPSDDLMTELLNAEFEDETGTTRRLTRDEVLTYVTSSPAPATRPPPGSSAGPARCSPTTPTSAASSSRTAR